MIKNILFIQLIIIAAVMGAIFGIFLFEITHFNYFINSSGDKRKYDKNMSKDLVDWLCNKENFKKVNYFRYITFKSN